MPRSARWRGAAWRSARSSSAIASTTAGCCRSLPRSALVCCSTAAPQRALRLDTLWQQDSRILEQQLEFLRYTCSSPPPFAPPWTRCCAIRIAGWRMSANERDISRPFKPGRDFAGKLLRVAPRGCADIHPLHTTVRSLPARISVQSRADFLDTAENRFAKMVLDGVPGFSCGRSRIYLDAARAEHDEPQTQRLLRESARLRGMLKRNWRAVSSRRVCAHGAAAGQSGAAAQGRLPRIVALLAAVPRWGAAWLGMAVQRCSRPGRATWRRSMNTGCSSSWRRFSANGSPASNRCMRWSSTRTRCHRNSY